MSKRYVTARNWRDFYSLHRWGQRLNEADYEPHRMRPYGVASGKFSYRQMFLRHGRRAGNQRVARTVKHSARQQARRLLEEGICLG